MAVLRDEAVSFLHVLAVFGAHPENSAAECEGPVSHGPPRKKFSFQVAYRPKIVFHFGIDSEMHLRALTRPPRPDEKHRNVRIILIFQTSLGLRYANGPAHSPLRVLKSWQFLVIDWTGKAKRQMLTRVEMGFLARGGLSLLSSWTVSGKYNLSQQN